MNIQSLFASLEEEATGEFSKEIEHVFYARITDFKQLERADSKVRQEQWEIKLPFTKENAAKGSLRVRSIKESDKPTQYVFTSKLSLNESGDKMEVSLDTTAEQFVTFKFLAAQGMVKDRYTFNLENGLKWEIDVFVDPTGGYFQWCKIDFEVPNHDTVVPEFPIDFNDIITDGPGAERDDATSKRISELYDNYFLTKNQYRKTAETKVEREDAEENKNKVQEEVTLD